MYYFTAIVTSLAILFYFFTSVRVARARVVYGVKLPAISGNPDFERVFRVQMNTLEWMPIFLPSLWLFAVYVSDAIAAGIGLVWIAGRYSKRESRSCFNGLADDRVALQSGSIRRSLSTQEGMAKRPP
jgi:uncharacterized membrane protein YecN with MAPEG domain